MVVFYYLLVNIYTKVEILTKKEFIDNVISDVSIDGILPFNVPPKTILRTIEKSLKKFYEYDNRASQENILFIDTSSYGQNCSTIKLPGNILSVTRLEHSQTSIGLLVGTDPISGVSSRSGVGTGGVINQVSIGLYNSLLKLNTIRFIPYDYSEHSCELILLAPPLRNLFAEVSVKLEEEHMYNMNDFEEYVVAGITLIFIKINNFIKTKLIGNREINFDEMRKEAEKKITDIEKTWEDSMGDGTMLLD